MYRIIFWDFRETQRVMHVNDVHFNIVFDHLAQLLTVLITLDHIIENHATLKDHWTLYKREYLCLQRAFLFIMVHLLNIQLEEQVFSGMFISTKICLQNVKECSAQSSAV